MITNANPILEQCAIPQRSKQRKPFIVDAPAPMLRRSNELKLSKHVRHLYMTMRALANGKTGELRIRDRWLRAEYIGREADMCRNVRLRSMRELVAAGFVSVDRERVLRIVNGRKRVVMGQCHYSVHRNPIDATTTPKPQILLKSLSCTVQEKDPQYVSNPPRNAGLDVGCGSSKGCASDGYSSSESPQTQTQIDDTVHRNHTQIKEETSKEKDLKPEMRAWMRARILDRSTHKVENEHNYVRTALPGFLADLPNEIEEYLAKRAAAYLSERFEANVASVGWKEIVADLTADAMNHGLPVNREMVIRAIDEGYERGPSPAIVCSEHAS